MGESTVKVKVEFKVKVRIKGFGTTRGGGMTAHRARMGGLHA